MKLNSVEVTKEQKDFLNLIVFEDGADSIGGANGATKTNAVQWCIDSCMKIEKLYGIDACHIAHNDIRLPENNEHPLPEKDIQKSMSIVYYNNARNMTQEEFTNWLTS